MRDGRSVYFYELKALLRFIEGPNRDACEAFLERHAEEVAIAPGSVHNHQAWPGGYVDHVTEVMNVAKGLYETLSTMRPLPFPLSDAMLVLFLHDIEKPFRFAFAEDGSIFEREELRSRDAKDACRAAKIAFNGFVLTDAQIDALAHVEGEIDDYSAARRVMSPLAAFCHLCDVTSARIWFDHPLASGEKVLGSRRSVRD